MLELFLVVFQSHERWEETVAGAAAVEGEVCGFIYVIIFICGKANLVYTKGGISTE